MTNDEREKTVDRQTDKVYPQKVQIPLDPFVNEGGEAAKRLGNASHWLRLLLFVSGAQRILEIGTGNGYLTAVMAQEVKASGGWVFSVEPSHDVAVAARRRWESLDAADAIQQGVGDTGSLLAQRLPDSFDCIVQHAQANALETELDQCLRVLRVGGFLAAFRPQPDAASISSDIWLSPQDALVQRLTDCQTLETVFVPGGGGLLVARKPEPLGGVIAHEYLD